MKFINVVGGYNGMSVFEILVLNIYGSLQGRSEKLQSITVPLLSMGKK